MSASSDGLSAPHVMEYAYRRSLGPVLGRFFTGLRDGRVEGVKTADGRVLVPPSEYDPETGEATTDEWVAVGPGGVVQSWAWVAEPRANHPLDRPFAWALIRLDGADTAITHVVDTGDESALSTGMRVEIAWAEARTGAIGDIARFVPEGTAPALKAAPAKPDAEGEGDAKGEAEPVQSLTTPTRVEYEYTPGVAATRYLRGLAEGKLLGQASETSGLVYIPARGACPRDGVPLTREVEVADKGTVVTLTVVRVPSANIDVELPYCVANILLDGANLSFTGLIQECPLEDVRIGMRVQAVWKDPSEWETSSENIRYFKPIDEPDVPFEQLRGVS